ncbi:putative neprosin [Helianthus anomalus]
MVAARRYGSKGNWWMQFRMIMCWATSHHSSFSYLSNSSTSMIEWGGEVVNLEPLGQHNGQRAASYFRNIQVVDKENNLKSPKDIGTFI